MKSQWLELVIIGLCFILHDDIIMYPKEIVSL
ncbi:hypothetical protein M2459_003643 [Parabacteroides sp. PF5-5]|nr:hypothetical protein [Parabacteroides sp. PH5-39]MDH6316234.1 hypothetical protein [Parabacteroides sp. PF5-13]MDH6320344.1 hypothetical protein [Parabacteroides sp. PH5-13]MDH6324074.1 hypothetical protein [Parabacteroides sp. PH5-8]MDH6329066.1 hypothetical protein [Parabacteroides sp. PH5-41]MDH6336868.1 hypothetical protein [Parabacteroides sp. PF5-5]MDH6347929.1 hypothetical protein [Parabacteroides sp. PH5-46]MDH6361247.1 hypothetical protein [Parabacteroides sp. PH5-16]MDH6376781.